MSIIGKTILVKGELRSGEDLTIEGHVHGLVWGEGIAVTLASSAQVQGDIVARDITVFGEVTGQLIATDVVDIRKEANAQGTIIAPHLILADGAQYAGRVEPQHLEAALRVARFNQKKRDAQL